jgi:hypothetical protein
MCIGVHDFPWALFADGFVQGIDTKVSMHGVCHAPAQHRSRCPIHDRHQIQIPPADRDEGDVRTPDRVLPLAREV